MTEYSFYNCIRVSSPRFRDPYLRVSVSKFSGLVPVSKATGLDHKPISLNIARTWLSKTSVIQKVFSLLCWQVRNNENRWEKCQKFEKSLTWEVVTTFCWKFLAKSTNFEASSLGPEVLTKFLSRRLRSRLHRTTVWCYQCKNKSTIITDLSNISFCVYDSANFYYLES